MFKLTLALIAVSLAALVDAQNYCNPNLCGQLKHIGCNHNGGWSAACPASPAPFIIQMNDTLSTHIVRMHNIRRDRLARGLITGYSTARRMGTMRWNAELASLARLNVLQCQAKEDACHNTVNFRNSGQNLFHFTYEGPWTERTNEMLITRAINTWWFEHENANMAVINSYPASWTGSPIRHFALMAQQANIAVGCAASRFVTDGLNNFLLACNYAVSNVAGQRVYAAGVVGSQCQLGTNVNFDGLCKFAEIYNV
ncbi:antigen 5 like allergen Cul n 1-like [Drosophila busckii]|uniref:antigen 5 like allergen Cul n 1-like n=1 Tax=Drosophila busckii TaxID=30019 RepID=UPI001432FB64|nr:antigen 5 like allergen Cul n 1-like [Drosophila busckii]